MNILSINPQAAQAQAVAVLRNSGHGENIRVCMG